MSDSKETTETEVSNVPWLDPAKAFEMTEEPYPPVGLRIFSVKGVGERPHLKKADTKSDDPAAYAAQAPLDPEVTPKEASKPKRQTPRKSSTTRKSAGSKAGTTQKES